MIPLWVKLAYSAFTAVLVPIYLVTYGPANFLYFCDVALLFTLIAVWTESPLLAGMPAVGILLPQLFWVADFVAGFFGVSPIGLAEYMFRDSIPLRARAVAVSRLAAVPAPLARLAARLRPPLVPPRGLASAGCSCCCPTSRCPGRPRPPTTRTCP